MYEPVLVRNDSFGRGVLYHFVPAANVILWKAAGGLRPRQRDNGNEFDFCPDRSESLVLALLLVRVNAQLVYSHTVAVFFNDKFTLRVCENMF